MFEFKLTTPSEIVARAAARMKRRRIDSDLTQRELAVRSGVPYGTLRAFEETAKASFETVVKIAFALEAEDEFEALFPPRVPRRMSDVLDRPARQRVRKK